MPCNHDNRTICDACEPFLLSMYRLIVPVKPVKPVEPIKAGI